MFVLIFWSNLLPLSSWWLNLAEVDAEVFVKSKYVDYGGRLWGFLPLGATERVEVLAVPIVSLPEFWLAKILEAVLHSKHISLSKIFYLKRTMVTCCTLCFNINKVVNAVPCDILHRLYVAVLCFDSFMVLLYMCKCNFFYISNKSMVIPSYICVTLSNSEQHYVQICYT